MNSEVAILVPCYNEELTIAKVVNDFKKELPNAKVYVYDNNSKDKTKELAKKAGALINDEFRQGKGNVVRSMFRQVEADIYVMVDGDDTYPASEVHKLIKEVQEKKADVCIGDRLSNGTYAKENKRQFHGFGNSLVRFLINFLFKSNLKDIMSGYRAYSKEFVKNCPIKSKGFEIETELSIHSLDKNFLIKEIPITYKDRPEGSFSKLSTFKDGFKVLKTILWLFKDYKPLMFFSLISFLFFCFSLFFGIPVIIEYFENYKISKIPSAILATGLMGNIRSFVIYRFYFRYSCKTA